MRSSRKGIRTACSRTPTLSPPTWDSTILPSNAPELAPARRAQGFWLGSGGRLMFQFEKGIERVNMTTRLKLRLLVVCIAALAAVFLPAQLVMAKEDMAIAPKTHGWWTQTYIEGIGSVQPDVPEKGMLVENAPTGPIALSALRFSLKDGATAKRLRLSISGTPVITQPPVACITTTAFESAQGGAWEDGPGYKCKHSVPGVVNAEQTEIRFAVGRLAKRRSLSVVILAGGPTDRIAFAKPGRETLSLSVKTNSTPTPPPPTDAPPRRRVSLQSRRP